MATTPGNPYNITLGAGTLLTSPLGSVEPTDLTSAWDPAWVPVGYTDKGSKFNYDLKTSPIEVAETLDPVKIASTGRDMHVDFDMAEITATNLKRVMNGGTYVAGATTVYFEPPDIGQEVRLMVGFQSEDGLERWIFRQCLNTASVVLNREKAPNKSLYTAKFSLEKPYSGVAPFRAWFDSSRA